MTGAPWLAFGLALAAGWLLGGAGNWLADALPPWSPPAGQARAPLAPPRLEHWGALLLPRCWRERPRLPLLLLATMLCCAAAARWLEGGLAVGLAALYSAFLLAVLVIDLEQRRVLNVMLGPAAIFVAAASLLPPAPTLAMALLGGAIGFGLFLLLGILGRGALGAGDVKLMGVVGLMAGYPAILVAVLAGTLLGAAAALALLLAKRATRKSSFAYAPYLAIGGILALFNLLGG